VENVPTDSLRPRPLFALSMGDPAGIGPEIALKAFLKREFAESVLMVGDAAIMKSEANKRGNPININAIRTISEFKSGALNILDCGGLAPDSFETGKAQAVCGEASFVYISKAIELALSGEVDGVITNPISKESLALAGIAYPGHTEIFADKTGTTDFSMLFLLKNIGVAHVTTHCSLKKAIASITIDRVLIHINLLNDLLKQTGIAAPRIAVGGLNPHAGEKGLFGDEEITTINPAIERARQQGIIASGAFPPDTVFMRAFKGEFDGVVSMLHDHGFVALKSMDFENGVNVTIGLPIIRTSVGHGTAFDIASKGVAHETSLLCAHEVALRMHSYQKAAKK